MQLQKSPSLPASQPLTYPPISASENLSGSVTILRLRISMLLASMRESCIVAPAVLVCGSAVMIAWAGLPWSFLPRSARFLLALHVAVCVWVMDILIVTTLVLLPGLLVLSLLVFYCPVAVFVGVFVTVFIALKVVIVLGLSSAAVIGSAAVAFFVVSFAVLVSVGMVKLRPLALLFVRCFVVIAPVFRIQYLLF